MVLLLASALHGSEAGRPSLAAIDRARHGPARRRERLSNRITPGRGHRAQARCASRTGLRRARCGSAPGRFTRPAAVIRPSSSDAVRELPAPPYLFERGSLFTSSGDDFVLSFSEADGVVPHIVQVLECVVSMGTVLTRRETIPGNRHSLLRFFHRTTSFILASDELSRPTNVFGWIVYTASAASDNFAYGPRMLLSQQDAANNLAHWPRTCPRLCDSLVQRQTVTGHPDHSTCARRWSASARHLACTFAQPV